MNFGRHPERPLLLFALSASAGFGVVAVAVAATNPDAVAGPELAAFARPASVPFPADNPPTAEKEALGSRLFEDPRFSASGTLSCASCHVPALAFADGLPRGHGITGVPLPRNTPALWNGAWGETFFWDGRAKSLEDQVHGPVENPMEMAETMAAVSAKLKADPDARMRFQAAFPEAPDITPGTIAMALAAYERTLVSPQTRFDRFVAGDQSALNATEQQGFSLFTGKAGCVSCHQGWAFTDNAFHDIGLPGTDPGRGAILGLPLLDHAFKTPSLRELNWTAPYMHDGSLPTLEAVLDHYDHGIIERPSVSPDLPRIRLDPPERDALLAFLATLSSEEAPVPPATGSLTRTAALDDASRAGPASATAFVSQKNRQFQPAHIRIKAGETLKVVNDDTRSHNIRVFDPRLDFNSGVQEPGRSVSLAFPVAGQYLVVCAIHPTMKLVVDVGP